MSFLSIECYTLLKNTLYKDSDTEISEKDELLSPNSVNDANCSHQRKGLSKLKMKVRISTYSTVLATVRCFTMVQSILSQQTLD